MGASRMDWGRLLTGRLNGRKKGPDDERSEYLRDVDRIVFSDPFRRLARKTQVHPLNENDHIHTRLTHSLETSGVGRSLGEKAGNLIQGLGELPDGAEPRHLGEIVQAACLAHDIGNPPYGHSGETAIKSWFKAHPEAITHLHTTQQSDFTKFDGNAMAVRVLLSTIFVREGMSPTCAVLGAMLKYPWPSSFDAGKDKFSYFQSEADKVRRIAEALGLPELGGRHARHPLAFLTEAADDICYRIIDMEDATEMGILEDDFMLRALGPALGIAKDVDPGRLARYEAMHFRQRNSKLRAQLIGVGTRQAFDAFKDNYETIMAGELDPALSLMDLAAGGVLEPIRTIYASLYDRLFMSRRKAMLELGAQNVLGILLDKTVPEAGRLCTGGESFGKKRVRVLLGADAVDAATKDHPTCAYRMLLLVLDYIAGMTDHYAADLGRKLQGYGV